MQRKQKLIRNTIIGLIASALLAIIKLVAGLLGRSTALTADAIESLADSISSIIVWKAVSISDRAPDQEHPYGYGRMEAVASLSVGGMLLVACIYIVYESFHEIVTPHQPPAMWTLAIIVLVIAVKESLFRMVLRGADDFQSDAAHADAWHHRSDAITSLAALVGVTISIFGPQVLNIQSLVLADEIAALLSSGIIFVTAFSLIRPALRELLDAASPEMCARIVQLAAKADPPFVIEKVFVRKSGPRFYADIHLHVAPLMSVQDAHNQSGKLKALIMGEIPNLAGALIHIEPLP